MLLDKPAKFSHNALRKSKRPQWRQRPFLRNMVWITGFKAYSSLFLEEILHSCTLASLVSKIIKLQPHNTGTLGLALGFNVHQCSEMSRLSYIVRNVHDQCPVSEITFRTNGSGGEETGQWRPQIWWTRVRRDSWALRQALTCASRIDSVRNLFSGMGNDDWLWLEFVDVADDEHVQIWRR